MKRNSQAFVNQLLVCLLVTICFGGSIGLGTVWMRHQISVTAKANNTLLAKIEEAKRAIEDKTALIEMAQRPDELRRLNVEHRLGLVPMNEVEVKHVAEDPLERMARRLEDAVLTDRAPGPISLNLAQR
jgi:hypothetical protein